MRKWLFLLTLVAAFFLDNVFFGFVNLFGIRSDLMLAVTVSFGVLLGSGPAAAVGLVLGFLTDVFFNKIVGLTALTYMLAGLAAGMFYHKFYADNLIIPTVVCVVSFFIKEHIFFAASLIMGARPPYFLTLAAYLLPSLLLTGGSCFVIHMFLKKTLFKPLWRNESIDVDN